MEKQFVVPAVTFLVGFFVWLIYIILHGVLGVINKLPMSVDIIISVMTATLIAYSAISCKINGGPRIGSIVRSGVLTVLMLVSLWQLGKITVIFFIVALMITMPMIFMKYESK